MCLVRVPGNIIDLVPPLLVDRQRQSEVHERIKSDRDLWWKSAQEAKVESLCPHLLALWTN